MNNYFEVVVKCLELSLFNFSKEMSLLVACSTKDFLDIVSVTAQYLSCLIKFNTEGKQ